MIHHRTEATRRRLRNSGRLLACKHALWWLLCLERVFSSALSEDNQFDYISIMFDGEIINISNKEYKWKYSFDGYVKIWKISNLDERKEWYGIL